MPEKQNIGKEYAEQTHVEQAHAEQTHVKQVHTEHLIKEHAKKEQFSESEVSPLTLNEIPVSEIDAGAFGLSEGISEAIVSTGFLIPNAAPIGIIRKNRKTFVRLFKGSHTWKNVSEEGFLVANVVLDPILFVRSTFFGLEPSEFEFVDIGGQKFPTLKAAISWVAFKCFNQKHTEQALLADLLPVGAGVKEANRPPVPSAPNRGFSAVLEATVHATRYQLTGEEKYLEWIRHYKELVSKCGGEKEKLAIKLLYEALGL